jgi:hypothetical protein
MGMMIGIPFICYLFLMPFFEWTTTPSQPLTALAALLGLGMLLRTYAPRVRQASLASELFIFILLLLPIIERLVSVPLMLFDYPGFIVPVTCFFVMYPLSIILKLKAQVIKR